MERELELGQQSELIELGSVSDCTRGGTKNMTEDRDPLF